MDQRRCTVTLILSCALLVQSALLHADSRRPIELAWMPEGEHWQQAVIQTPQECLAVAEGGAADGIVLGRLVFESPALLGGRASRMGLSCAGCHRSGRSNAHFFIPLISDKAGSADVSHGLFGATAEDQISNPVAIPDLADRSSLRFRDRSSPGFEAHIHRLIEVEFDGLPPSGPVFSALLLYLNALDTQFCEEPDALTPHTWQVDWLRFQETMRHMASALLMEDEKLTSFLIRTARYRLEKIYNYYGPAGAADLDNALIAASEEIAKIKPAYSQHADLSKLNQLTSTIPDLLQRHAVRSFYVGDERAEENSN